MQFSQVEIYKYKLAHHAVCPFWLREQVLKFLFSLGVGKRQVED